MQFDFSALDAELERLGPPPEDAIALAHKYAPPELAAGATGRPLPLDQIDRALAALESDGEPLPPVSLEREPLPFAPSFATPPALVDAPADFPSQPPPAFAPAGEAPPASAPRASEPPEFADEDEPLPFETLASEPPEFASEPPAARRGPTQPPSPGDRDEPFGGVPPGARDEVRAEPATLTQSQEIVLPDPVRDDISPESGELRLDGEEPSSGSFELPESATVPRITPEERPSQTRAGEAPAGARGLEPFDDVQDALEGSQPIMLSAAPGRASHDFDDRDPDAEFDALLSEATDPRGIPTGAGASGEVDTDDLLRGLEGDDLDDEEVSAEELAAAHADEPHEADMLTRSLFEDAGESTEITDRSALLGAITTTKRAAADVTQADELDADDLEIVMEDDEDGATLAPPAGPQSSKAPPPPPPPGADKRPSLLGRLFNKREPGSE